MSPYDFNYRLSKLHQYAYIQQYGIKIAQRNNGNNRYFLYSVHSFFVEAKYHIALSAIQDATAYSFEEVPEIYLSEIDIKDCI